MNLKDAVPECATSGREQMQQFLRCRCQAYSINSLARSRKSIDAKAMGSGNISSAFARPFNPSKIGVISSARRIMSG
jgi:hypothetical protein